MANEFIKYAFVAGEVSKTAWARGDLEKYDLALARATNWFVDYRGGLSTRGGSQFLDYVEDDDKDTKFVPFKFAPAVASTYVLVFSHLKVRFMQAGVYVTEAARTITAITQANPGVVTSAAHGYANGDWVKLSVAGMTQLDNRTFEVSAVTANTFRLTDVLTGVQLNTTTYGAFTSGEVARIYTITTTYDAADLSELRAHQSRSVIYLTHPDYKVRKLTRLDHASWTLALAVFTSTLSRPGTPTVDAGAGAAGVGFQVTAVNAVGEESLPSDYGFDTTAVDYTTTAGQAKVSWTKVTGALYYRVYRTLVLPTGTDCSRAMQLGFVGIAYGNQFIDRNIIPDFTITPPVHQNPFADGAIEFIEVTAPGAGYTNASAVTITTGTGSGFVGYAVVDVAAGTLLAIAIVNAGSGYIAGDTVNVSVGAGATFSKTLSDASGNDPAVSSMFQQRKVYAASDNDPLTIWASKPGEPEIMDVSIIIQEDDSYEFELDSEEVAPIRHLLATRSGLVIISQAGIWQLTGGSGVAVTPTNALADPQSYTGCSPLPPLPIDTDILYVEGKGSVVRLLAYNDYTKVFAGQDLSILSNHLVKPSKPLTHWTFASDPFKIVHAVRSDGIMINLTLVKEQNVFGWTTQQTRGLYTDVLSIQEDRTDVVYTMVKRYVNGRWTKFIEQFVRREFDHVEDAWCVDCGASSTSTYPSAQLSASASAAGSGIVFTASSAVFASGDVGKVLRMGGGKAIITAFTDTTHVIGTLMREITAVIPETDDDGNIPLPAESGEWTLDEGVSAVQGLWHLEGETVKILADGNVLPDAVVTNGAVSLGNVEATRIIIGMGYKCITRTLPPVSGDQVIEAKRKRTVAVKMRLLDSRGLSAGTKLTNLIPMKERTDEAYNEPTRLQEGVRELAIPSGFDTEGQFYIVQDNPLPATLLGFIHDLEIGDVERRIS